MRADFRRRGSVPLGRKVARLGIFALAVFGGCTLVYTAFGRLSKTPVPPVAELGLSEIELKSEIRSLQSALRLARDENAALRGAGLQPQPSAARDARQSDEEPPPRADAKALDSREMRPTVRSKQTHPKQRVPKEGRPLPAKAKPAKPTPEFRCEAEIVKHEDVTRDWLLERTLPVLIKGDVCVWLADPRRATHCGGSVCLRVCACVCVCARARASVCVCV